MTTPTLLTAISETEDLQVDAYSNEPLLTALEMGGSNWPSSCRNGSCRTCVGQLTQGEVRYEMDWPGLTAEEKAEGYILPCVAFPCTPVRVRQGYTA
ncbi:2Fe-2S iron-sulfur cluster binding domain-containing protein [Curvibacter sp. APW13]|uniref:2Fe-2S iron-sulfur cluster-binding protein n=1 Tax=Curvibacter sp. APW13 TaxID=3077236 RepID=UPI0028E09CA9|nr:2Fe-2S iron-sulfur cluster binding domain-containing protein [Curvibacter sp. APW13]MDT8991955.1 2Fe-2S iron-sulfur cluster binding domain-containing protein [Curvibacter sp. APW13]